MTPLAHQIGKLILNKTPVAAHLHWGQLYDETHFFEISEVWPLVMDLARSIRETGNRTDTAFLAAPRMWIETTGIRSEGFSREAVLLEDLGDGNCRATHFGMARYGDGDGYCLTRPDNQGLAQCVFPLVAESQREVRGAILSAAEGYLGRLDPDEIWAALAIINTPRLIGRKQRMPHRGLERRLAAAKGMVGKFPLRAWTELKLSVAAMMTESDGTVHEAHYTGEKCLHFCRAHIRVKNGRLEQVKAHWRGNPALGLKRTRYKVVS
ncbi:MAG: hypothetical protein ACLGIM_14055 [Alphaproteobacteria bacterium]